MFLFPYATTIMQASKDLIEKSYQPLRKRLESSDTFLTVLLNSFPTYLQCYNVAEFGGNNSYTGDNLFIVFSSDKKDLFVNSIITFLYVTQ